MEVGDPRPVSSEDALPLGDGSFIVEGQASLRSEATAMGEFGGALRSGNQFSGEEKQHLSAKGQARSSVVE